MRIPALVIACSILPAQADVAPADAKVATHYFYWYRWPTEHFKAGRDGAEGHYHHFTAPEKVSYADADWHEGQFGEMAGCGIDFALPVYWGAPGAYERPSIRFSRAGLGPMVEALQRRERRRAPSVRLGLFYDTSTLLNDVRGAPPRGGKPDLREPAGKTLFCRTVVEYFERIPRRFWARVDGRALVVLYVSGFAAAWDESLGPALRRAFAQRFAGEGIYLVADRSWREIGQDRTTSWGAALHGPRIFAGVAQIGPGYDDSPVPGRRTPRRDREEGNFYRASWRQAIASKPELVLLETWNEMHEGTEICATEETGRLYLDLTREWIDRLATGELGPEIELRWDRPQPRPDRSWGSPAADADAVYADYGTGERFGLREIAWEDGPVQVRDRRLRPRGAVTGVTYLYFQVSDFFRFDVDQRFEIVLELDADPDADAAPDVVLEYDSRDTTATLSGSYTRAAGRASDPTPDGSLRIVYDLESARLANRQNGGADFRLCVRDARTAIRTVRLAQR